MPLEIRELIIRTNVENQSQEGSGTDCSEMDPKSMNMKEIAEMVLKLIKEKEKKFVSYTQQFAQIQKSYDENKAKFTKKAKKLAKVNMEI